ncbi:hypothetical protein [Marinactinospora rubrisoli]|uniref:N-formylglutamate amidohydrolase n=1 Tax=Marinactinospora rubrisoli TaxID=2715399 RepID=A0ABW2KLH3_9ACTN
MSTTDERHLAERWAALEAPFADTSYEGVSEQGAHTALRRVRGRVPVLLSAPHAVNHPREGRTKLADLGTGGLALLVAELTGARALAALSPVPDRDWADRRDPFAAALRAELADGAVVLDLHGMRDVHGMDVCLGTALRRDPATARLRDAALRALRGFTVTVDDPFPGAAPHTVLTEVAASGRAGLQVEIAGRLRDPVGAPRRAARIVRALAEIVRSYRDSP